MQGLGDPEHFSRLNRNPLAGAIILPGCFSPQESYRDLAENLRSPRFGKKLIFFSAAGFDVPLFFVRVCSHSCSHFRQKGARGMIYRYNSPVGSFTLRPDGSGQFELHINVTFLASYRTPEAAALDVSLHATGWKEWDLFPGHEGPQNLFEWERWRIRRSSPLGKMAVA